jgi:ketosteroid isomerase-like protein
MSLPTRALRPRHAFAMVSLLAVAACGRADGSPVTAAQRTAIADTLRTLIVSAYDLTRPGDAVGRLMSLYPSSGPVISASGGQVSTSRDSLEAGIRAFWENVGRNMRDPKWSWGPMHVDVLAPDAAVVTTTYRVPHLTPRGEPHVIAGAWTAVFQRRGGRWVIVQEHLSDVPAAMPATVPGTMPAMPMTAPPPAAP